METASIIIASMVVAGVVSSIFFYISLIERKKYFIAWSLGWFMFLIAYILRYRIIDSGGEGLVEFSNYFATLVSSWLVFRGSIMFLEVKISRYWVLNLAAAAVWYILMFFRDVPSPLSTLYGVVFICVLYLRAGKLFMKTMLIKGSIKYVLGVTFILWGCMVGLSPLFLGRGIEALPLSLGYLVIGAVGLAVAVNIIAVYFQKIREHLKISEEKIRYLSFHDALTGLFNRHYLEDQLQLMDKESSLPLSIVMGDMNGLKLVNDTFGHDKGDEMIIKASQIIAEACGKEDIAIRWGGDEFVLLLPRTDGDACDRLISKLKKACMEDKTGVIPISISFGWATKVNGSQDIRMIIKEAEDRMYANKQRESTFNNESFISFLQQTLERQSPQTGEHTKRVRKLTGDLGRHLKLTDEEMQDLLLAADLHDIGKIAIPQDILHKQGPLTEEENEILKSHCGIGCRAAQASIKFSHISKAILHHHEWWNGGGYPGGLKGKDIPLYSRIIAIADTYDIIASDPAYYGSGDTKGVLKQLERRSGSQLDPELTSQFIKMQLLTA